MDDNLTDQQQAEVVKQWLKDNGLSILVSIGLGISAYFGAICEIFRELNAF